MEILFYIGLVSAILCFFDGLNELRLFYKAQKKYPDIDHSEKFLNNLVWIISNISAIAMYMIFDDLFYKFWIIYCFVAIFLYSIFDILLIVFMDIIVDFYKKVKENRIKKEELKRPKLKFKI